VLKGLSRRILTVSEKLLRKKGWRTRNAFNGFFIHCVEQVTEDELSSAVVGSVEECQKEFRAEVGKAKEREVQRVARAQSLSEQRRKGMSDAVLGEHQTFGEKHQSDQKPPPTERSGEKKGKSDTRKKRDEELKSERRKRREARKREESERKDGVEGAKAELLSQLKSTFPKIGKSFGQMGDSEGEVVGEQLREGRENFPNINEGADEEELIHEGLKESFDELFAQADTVGGVLTGSKSKSPPSPARLKRMRETTRLKLHGNYCGPNHEDPSFVAPPVDPIDELCRDHKRCLAKFTFDCGCDERMSSELRRLSSKVSAAAVRLGEKAVSILAGIRRIEQSMLATPCSCRLADGTSEYVGASEVDARRNDCLYLHIPPLQEIV